MKVWEGSGVFRNTVKLGLNITHGSVPKPGCEGKLLTPHSQFLTTASALITSCCLKARRSPRVRSDGRFPGIASAEAMTHSKDSGCTLDRASLRLFG